MKIGIAVDDWKVPIFKEILTVEGYTFKVTDGLTTDMRMITVEAPEIKRIKSVVQKCQNKCAELKN